MPCSSPFHFKSHFESKLLLFLGTHKSQEKLRRLSSNSAVEYDAGSCFASLRRQTDTFVFSRPAYFAASSAWYIRPPSQGPVLLISPAADFRLSALVCDVVLPSPISSPYIQFLTSALLVSVQQSGPLSGGSELHRQKLARRSHPEMKSCSRAIRC